MSFPTTAIVRQKTFLIKYRFKKQDNRGHLNNKIFLLLLTNSLDYSDKVCFQMNDHI